MTHMRDLKAYCEKEKVHEILRYAEACSLRDYLVLLMLWESLGKSLRTGSVNTKRLGAA